MGAGSVIQGLQSAVFMHSLGAYIVEIENTYGWSKTALSGAFALNRAETALLGPVQGRLIERVGPLMQALRADYFGSSAFASIMGVSSMIVMVGPMLGPFAAGWMADATGSYATGFVALAALTALGILFFVATKPPAPPPRRPQA